MNKYSEYCKKVFNSELKKEGLSNVTLKIINSPLVKSNGYVKPNINDGTYQIVINLNSFKNLDEQNKMFYIYESIAHEIEHVKTYEMTKGEDFYSYEHLISLLEYLSYLYELKQPATKYNMGLVKRILLSRSRFRNYDVSTSEIKASLEGFKKAKENCEKDSKNTDIIINSLEFLNDNLEIMYDRNRTPCIKLNIFLKNAYLYLREYPELLDKYKMLRIIFNEKGIKSIEELYSERNEKNGKIIDNVILSLVSQQNIPESEVIRAYIADLISRYNQKTIDFYRNMKIGKVYIDDDKKLNDNLQIMIRKSKYLNKVLQSMGKENQYGMIL